LVVVVVVVVVVVTRSPSASGNAEMLLYLLSSSRFDVTMVSSDGSTPLHYFIRSFPDSPSAEESVKFTEAVQALIDNGWVSHSPALIPSP